MPSVIATLRVKAEKLDEARTFLKQLAIDTLAREPGTLAYTVHQKKGEPTTFVFYEKYANDQALAEHSANLKAVGAGFAAVLAGPPEIVLLEEV